jgi:hypothetical protein
MGMFGGNKGSNEDVLTVNVCSIHTDTEGNVFSGCGDGVHVYVKRILGEFWIAPLMFHRWNNEGVLLGKIAVANGGVNNFAFVPGGMCKSRVTSANMRTSC